MRFLRAAGRELLGLFVSDWVQSGVIVVILAGGWLAVSRVGAPALVLLVLLLAAQLVWFALAEGRRSARRSPRQFPG
ncbi:MAG: hypothetical protein E6I06_07385 [Chloroflexi bacterium]|nr:MAG: hypothetical protein E6I13_03900 [Chloroflexota bacterium]TMG09070.1 MAG: hypothetical protein E6I06_07385 [Chloroflexota bacterium]TMG19837.1 MAG: hypothetical protein E6H99_09785 [Chloroflexota bacterium]TMG64420.1 MAG: hypothetical protein E6H82_14445 [Chloroflexota bacterium]